MLKRARRKLAAWAPTVKRSLLQLRSYLVSLYNRSPHRFGPKSETRRAHAGIIADLFASIMCRVDGLALEDMDTTMDILRYDSPM